VGARYQEYTNLAAPVPVRGVGGGLEVPAGASATAWADGLEPEGAEVLAGYEHPHLGRWAAITTRRHGAGRVTYVGTLPDRALAVALARWLRPAEDPWAARPETVTVTSATNRAGGRIHFVANWSWETTTVPLPVAAVDLIEGAGCRPGEALDLGAWDVRVLAEQPGEEHNGEGST
jgi:beta-galactosidase